MTQALWCEAGNHPFSEKDEKKRTYSEQIEYGKDDYGEPRFRTEHFTICGECASIRAPFQQTKDAPANSESSTTAKELEAAKAEADMWRTKYEANMAYGKNQKNVPGTVVEGPGEP